jgi:hypothetical protein
MWSNGNTCSEGAEGQSAGTLKDQPRGTHVAIGCFDRPGISQGTPEHTISTRNSGNSAISNLPKFTEDIPEESAREVALGLSHGLMNSDSF